MPQAVTDALQTTLVYYLGRTLVLALSIFFCLRLSLKSGPKADKFAYLTVGLVVVFLWSAAFRVIPLVREYHRQDVCVATGEYRNPVQSKSGSGLSGMDAVTLVVDGQTLSLTTYPLNHGQFPTGSYPVTAWYTPGTGFLLHITFPEASAG